MHIKEKIIVMKEVEEANRRHVEEWKRATAQGKINMCEV